MQEILALEAPQAGHATEVTGLREAQRSSKLTPLAKALAKNLESRVGIVYNTPQHTAVAHVKNVGISILNTGSFILEAPKLTS